MSPTVAMGTEFLDGYAHIPASQQKKVRDFLKKFRDHPTSNAMGAVRFATGIFTLPEAIALARPCESELLVGHGVGPDIAGRSR